MIQTTFWGFIGGCCLLLMALSIGIGVLALRSCENTWEGIANKTKTVSDDIKEMNKSGASGIETVIESVTKDGVTTTTVKRKITK